MSTLASTRTEYPPDVKSALRIYENDVFHYPSNSTSKKVTRTTSPRSPTSARKSRHSESTVEAVVPQRTRDTNDVTQLANSRQCGPRSSAPWPSQAGTHGGGGAAPRSPQRSSGVVAADAMYHPREGATRDGSVRWRPCGAGGDETSAGRRRRRTNEVEVTSDTGPVPTHASRGTYILAVNFLCARPLSHSPHTLAAVVTRWLPSNGSFNFRNPRTTRERHEQCEGKPEIYMRAGKSESGTTLDENSVGVISRNRLCVTTLTFLFFTPR